MFQILKAFSKEDTNFVTSCSQLIAQSERVVSMPQYEFRNICDTKLESIRKRVCNYQQVCVEKPILSVCYFSKVYTPSFFSFCSILSLQMSCRIKARPCLSRLVLNLMPWGAWTLCPRTVTWTWCRFHAPRAAHQPDVPLASASGARTPFLALTQTKVGIQLRNFIL